LNFCPFSILLVLHDLPIAKAIMYDEKERSLGLEYLLYIKYILAAKSAIIVKIFQ